MLMFSYVLGGQAIPIFAAAKRLVTRVNSEMFGGSTLCQAPNTSRTIYAHVLH